LVYGDEDLNGPHPMKEICAPLLSDNSSSFVIRLNKKFNWKIYGIERDLYEAKVGSDMLNKQTKPTSIGSYIDSKLAQT